MDHRPIYIGLALLWVYFDAVLSECPNGWMYYGQSCYLFGHRRLRFSDAETECRDEGGHLVAIESAEENDFLKNSIDLFRVREYWIGLTDSASECYWEWTGSDAFLLFYDWVRYQPGTNAVTNCAAMLEKNDYHWMDVSCTNLYRAICERPKSGESSDAAVSKSRRRVVGRLSRLFRRC